MCAARVGRRASSPRCSSAHSFTTALTAHALTNTYARKSASCGHPFLLTTVRNFWTSAAGTDATEGEADSFSALIRDRMKLQRVEISEDERAELLTQHQQGLSATAKRLNVRPAVKPRALSSSTGRTQNGTSWSRRPSLPMKVAADSLQASFRRV